MGFIRQFAGVMVSPMVIVLMLCVLALLLHWRARARAGSVVFAAAGILLYLFSINPVADLLIARFESQYPPLPADTAAPRYVVVLGSSYSPRAGAPVTAALDPDGLARIVEGVRLLRQWPAADLVVSGGPAGPDAPARGYERMARELGVEPGRIHVLDTPENTAAEGVAIAAVVKGDSLVLVTSAFHMPRAMKEMQAHGLHPVAAPTANPHAATRSAGIRSIIPNATALRRSEFALREALATLAQSVGAGA